MSYEIWQNEADAVARRVPVFLEDISGNPYTGSLAGFTIQFMKPGGSDGNVSLTSLGGGRYYYAASAGDVDTKGAGWMTVTSAGVILPWIDPVVIRGEEPDIATILSDIVTTLADVVSMLSTLGTVNTNVSNIQTRIPSALVGGKMDSHVNDIAAEAVTTAACANGFLTNAKVADGLITTGKVADGFLTNAKLASNLLAAGNFAAGAFAAVGPYVGTAVVYGSRTLRGVMKRLDRMLIGKAAGLDASTATFYDEDGTSKVVEFTQDTGAGTRQTASTANGD